MKPSQKNDFVECKQFVITLTLIGNRWDAQGLGSVGYGETAFGAVNDLEKEIFSRSCEAFILNSKQIVELPLKVVAK